VQRWARAHISHTLLLACRDDVVRMLLEVFTSASKPSTKSAFVRDALVTG